MLLYLDANCLHRPFNDQSQARIRRETEAVLQVLTRIINGDDRLAWSSALTLELTAHPEPEIREQLLSWKTRSQITLRTSKVLLARIQAFVGQGLKPLDASHVAFAEAAGCDAILTCDDRLLRRAARLRLSLRAINPVEYCEEVRDAGTHE
jgi:predicted nucleic acid-binding protein